MSQRVLIALDNAQKKIIAAGRVYDDKLNMANKKQRAEAVKKTSEAYEKAVFNYCNIVINAIADNDIESDPFAIIYGRGLTGSLGKASLAKAFDQIRNESPEVFTKVDIVMSKAVSEGLLKKWKSHLSNGVKLIVNNKGIQFMSGWIKEKIQWSMDTISDFIAWVKEKFANFRKVPDPVVVT